MLLRERVCSGCLSGICCASVLACVFLFFCWVFVVLLCCERVCSQLFCWVFVVQRCERVFLLFCLIFAVLLCERVFRVLCWVFAVLLCERVCSGSLVGYLLCFCVVSVCVPIVLLGICCATV